MDSCAISQGPKFGAIFILIHLAVWICLEVMFAIIYKQDGNWHMMVPTLTKI